MAIKKLLFPLQLNRYFVLVMFLFTATMIAQNHKFDWAKNIGGSSKKDFVSYNTVCVDNSGNTYNSGIFNGTVDFNPGVGVFNISSSGAGQNAFICKLDPSGNFIWAKQIRSISSNLGGSMQPNSVKVNAKGDVFLTGWFSGLMDFNPGFDSLILDTAIGADGFVLKLNNKGDFVWAMQIKNHRYGWSNQPSNCSPTSLALDPFGNSVISGSFYGKIDCSPGSDSFYITSSYKFNNSNRDIFIMQLDSNGKFNWAKSINGERANDGITSMCTDAQGNSYSLGKFYDTLDFNPGVGVYNMISNGNSDVFILKLDVSGQFKWSKSFGGSGGDDGWKIVLDSFGSVYTNGYFVDTVDFDPGIGVVKISSYLNSRSFVSKLDSNGGFLWAKSIKSYGNNTTYITSFEIDANGNCYFMGNIGGKVDLDPSSDTFEMNIMGRWKYDKFICSWNKFGKLTWGKQMVSNKPIYDGGIVKNANNLFFLGYYFDTLTYDPESLKATMVTSTNTASSFMLKFSACTPDTTINNIVACRYYTWSDGKTYALSNNKAFRNLINKNGCDSLVKLNLTILFPNENTMPQICAVSVDSSSGKNEIIWEKQGLNRATNYNVYRENSNSQFIKIGSLNRDSFSTFIDTGSNPLIQSYRYKITLRDSCGVESALDSSIAHKTVHLTSNIGVGGEVNLIWNTYEGKSYTAHNIMRSVNGGAYAKIAQVSSNVSSYSDLTPPSGVLSYVIYLSTTKCIPTRAVYSEIKSNPIYIRPTSINTLALPFFVLFPNPANDFIEIKSIEEMSKIEIFDPIGNLIYTGLSNAISAKIDVASYSSGVYFVKVTASDRGSSIQRIIIE